MNTSSSSAPPSSSAAAIVEPQPSIESKWRTKAPYPRLQSRLAMGEFVLSLIGIILALVLFTTMTAKSATPHPVVVGQSPWNFDDNINNTTIVKVSKPLLVLSSTSVVIAILGMINGCLGAAAFRPMPPLPSSTSSSSAAATFREYRRSRRPLAKSIGRWITAHCVLSIVLVILDVIRLILFGVWAKLISDQGETGGLIVLSLESFILLANMICCIYSAVFILQNRFAPTPKTKKTTIEGGVEPKEEIEMKEEKNVKFSNVRVKKSPSEISNKSKKSTENVVLKSITPVPPSYRHQSSLESRATVPMAEFDLDDGESLTTIEEAPKESNESIASTTTTGASTYTARMGNGAGDDETNKSIGKLSDKSFEKWRKK